ncbi:MULTISPECIES: carboxymuconolactone decarboxylase family protein [unclassified Amycolatopsis]|uniref:carboxymuconolactone decarboxylase family protein n=1 Tax=unclassified Amycolatopsis TaxID=2618356 RepID=UPI0028766FE1|nr:MULTISPECIES: carboxymuconolactone decarboxylase family protein [unclassified Amycolatopsis]MDS0136218.1 carboxymuconolactone decarboxylase family protein [Amycolatopsis sp. 505]MDS0145733.1 carboxymuconolactone decarboxylase family protein [Amycolatopsis sp. CM201R]
MSYLKSLPSETTLLQVFQAYPGPARHLLAFHELVLRGESPFTPGERELIAAYVSGLNSCDYCHGIHTVTAEAFGIPEGTLAAALADLESANVDARLKPVLAYVGKLTRTPSKMTDADAEAVFAAGWDERALHDAVLVCALFNFMNRMVEGLGIRADEAYTTTSGERLKNAGYAGLAELLNAPA